MVYLLKHKHLYPELTEISFHVTPSECPKYTLFQSKAKGSYTPVVYSSLEYYYRVCNELGQVFYRTALLKLDKTSLCTKI